MLDLDFKKPETFKTEDGDEWMIKKLSVKNMPLVYDFIEVYDKKSDLEFGTEEFKEVLYVQLPERCLELINLSVKNVEDEDKPFPEEELSLTKMIQIALLICDTTMEFNNPIKRGGIPLGQEKKKSESSKPTFTPSKKKDGRKKKS